MRLRTIVWLTIACVMALGVAPLAWAADDSKVNAATERVEKGGKEIGKGVEETAKGIGNTGAEGAKYTGDKLKESGKAAEPTAKSAWHKTRDGAADFGSSVKKFFSNLFGN